MNFVCATMFVRLFFLRLLTKFILWRTWNGTGKYPSKNSKRKTENSLLIYHYTTYAQAYFNFTFPKYTVIKCTKASVNWSYVNSEEPRGKKELKHSR